jgi:hypothetical protein
VITSATRYTRIAVEIFAIPNMNAEARVIRSMTKNSWNRNPFSREYDKMDRNKYRYIRRRMAVSIIMMR